MTIHELETPILICDLNIAEKNCRDMQAICDEHGCDLRPHIKTHKTPELARLQLELGAHGLTVAKLGEAEVMREQAGCDDIFIAYSLLGEAKLKRLRALLDVADIRVSVVSYDQAQLLSDGLKGHSVKVRMNIDTGLLRDGMTAEASLRDAERIANLPGLELVGVFTHEGQAHSAGGFAQVKQAGREAAQTLIDVAAELRSRGVPCAEVCPGATPTAAEVATMPGVTEVRPGTYIFYDAMCMKTMDLTPDDCATRVITTVVDLPAKNRVILDGGSKTFFNDQSPQWGRAFCLEHPDLRLEKCSEEHGHGEWRGEGAPPMKLGDRLTWIPNHVCPVVNLFDRLVAVRGEEVEEVWDIAARGKIQ